MTITSLFVGIVGINHSNKTVLSIPPEIMSLEDIAFVTKGMSQMFDVNKIIVYSADTGEVLYEITN